jgi:biotin operon repressor
MKRPQSKEELIEKTGYSYDGIRGRISEIRKLGYDIDYEIVEEKKYVLKKTREQKLLNFLKDKRLYGQAIDIKKVARYMEVPVDDVIKEISELFNSNEYTVMQVSNNKVKIFENF